MSCHNLTQAIDLGRQARELLLKQGRHLAAIEQGRNDFAILMEIRDWLKDRTVKTEDGTTVWQLVTPEDLDKLAEIMERVK